MGQNTSPGWNTPAGRSPGTGPNVPPGAPVVRFGGSAAGGARGAVTAEFAVTLPVVVALLAMLLAGVAAGATQLRIEEGARSGARALARGEEPATVEQTVRTLAGGTATATVATEGEWFSITVTDRVAGPLGTSVPWTLTAKASTRAERTGGPVGGIGLTDGKGNR